MLIYMINSSERDEINSDAFGEGNVSEGYTNFIKTHSCNIFCKYYDLTPLVTSHRRLSLSSKIPGLDYI